MRNIFSVPALGRGRGRWGGVGEVLHVWWAMWKWWICLYTEQRWVCSIHFIVIIQVEICLYLVRRAKLLGVIITSDLSWNEHVNETVKTEAYKCFWLRSILSLCTPVFFYALPKYLQSELERVQTRALSIIFPSLSYDEALDEAGIPTIISYREDIWVNVFNTAHGNTDNKL